MFIARSILAVAVAILLHQPDSAQAQQVVALFDISGSVKSAPEDANNYDNRPAHRQSRRGLLINVLAQVYQEANVMIEVVPWNHIVHQSFYLQMGYDKQAVGDALINRLPTPGHSTQLGNALKEVGEQPDCKIFLVFTDGTPDDMANLENILPPLTIKAPVGIFVINRYQTRFALKQFKKILQSPRYLATVLNANSIVSFIKEQSEAVGTCGMV